MIAALLDLWPLAKPFVAVIAVGGTLVWIGDAFAKAFGKEQ